MKTKNPPINICNSCFINFCVDNFFMDFDVECFNPKNKPVLWFNFIGLYKGNDGL